MDHQKWTALSAHICAIVAASTYMGCATISQLWEVVLHICAVIFMFMKFLIFEIIPIILFALFIPIVMLVLVSHDRLRTLTLGLLLLFGTRFCQRYQMILKNIKFQCRPSKRARGTGFSHVNRCTLGSTFGGTCKRQDNRLHGRFA